MKIFMSVAKKNQQEIRSNLIMKIFMALLKKNQQGIRSKVLIKIFMSLLIKKSTRKRVLFTNEDIYGSVDKKSTYKV